MRLIDISELPNFEVSCSNGKKYILLPFEHLTDIPTVNAEPVKHGRWLPQMLLGERVWDCSECATLGSPHWKRCPVCEAKMDGEREKE